MAYVVDREETMFRRYHEAHIEYCVGRLHIEPDDPALASLCTSMKDAWKAWLVEESIAADCRETAMLSTTCEEE